MKWQLDQIGEEDDSNSLSKLGILLKYWELINLPSVTSRVKVQSSSTRPSPSVSVFLSAPVQISSSMLPSQSLSMPSASSDSVTTQGCRRYQNL